MKPTDFCYWLQGVFELGQPTDLNERQVDVIRAHLDLVFKHEIVMPVDVKSTVAEPFHGIDFPQARC